VSNLAYKRVFKRLIGASYEYDPTKSGSNKAENAFQPVQNMIYRGVVYRVDPNPKPMEISAVRVTQKLMYRGATYYVNKNLHREVTVTSQPASTSQIITPSLSET
jgi:hypothetical protein